MDFEQLHQLEAIERTGTFSAAARELHMSQPALTRSMQRLEAELGQQLFDRVGRSAQLNEAGRIALDYAKQILREARLMREALNEHARRARALVVGSVAPAPLWRLTALVVERFPAALLTSQTLDVERVEREVLNEGIDLGISLRPYMMPTVRCCPLMTESLSVCLPASHPLAKRKSLSAAELDGESFLLYQGIGFWQDFCNTHFPHSKFVVQEDRTMFEQMIPTTPLMYFVTDVPSLMNAVPEGRVVVPIKDTAAHATYYLLMHENARQEAHDIFDWVRMIVSRYNPCGSL